MDVMQDDDTANVCRVCGRPMLMNGDVCEGCKKLGSNGLLPCGCGGKAVRERIEVLYSGKEVPMYSVRCERYHVNTRDHARQDQADKDWMLAMGGCRS